MAQKTFKKEQQKRAAGSTVRASLSEYNQAPRKVRLVTDLIRGKTVRDALVALAFLDKRAARPIAKLVLSAAANAKQAGIDPDTLRIERVSVDAGMALTRMRARAFGRGATIKKRRSHVTLVLGPAPAGKKKVLEGASPATPAVVEKAATE